MHLAAMGQESLIDFVLHDGDIGSVGMGLRMRGRLAFDQPEVLNAPPTSPTCSYADGYQPLWDSFMRKMESIAGFVPYMTTPGNHEVGLVGTTTTGVHFNVSLPSRWFCYPPTPVYLGLLRVPPLHGTFCHAVPRRQVGQPAVVQVREIAEAIRVEQCGTSDTALSYE